MPRYFFDIHNDGPHRDDIGTELDDLDAVRRQAVNTLSDVARDELRANGDRHTFTVLVADEQDRPVYSATLTFTGLWLQR